MEKKLKMKITLNKGDLQFSFFHRRTQFLKTNKCNVLFGCGGAGWKCPACELTDFELLYLAAAPPGNIPRAKLCFSNVNVLLRRVS